jgi:tetratricopeptide (TPR) repeat protein
LIFLILLIFSIFLIVLGSIWMWFFRSEKDFCEKIYEMGIKEFNAEQYKKAKTLFSKVIDMVPNYKDAKYRLGLTYLKLKNHENARVQFEESLSDSPNNFDILYNLASSLQSLEKFDEAETIYLKAMKENDKSTDSYFGLGLVKYNQKDFMQALEFFTKADELAPNNNLYSFYINRCKDAATDYEDLTQGTEIINNYLGIENTSELPNDFELSLAIAYAKMGNIEEAEKYCKQALMKNSEDVESYKVLGLINLVRKDFDATKSFLKTALNLQPDNHEVHDILSYALCYQVDNCSLVECREKYFKLVKKFLK